MGAKLGGTEFQGLSWSQDTAWTSASVAADKDASLSFGVLKDNVATNPMILTSDGFLAIGGTAGGSVYYDDRGGLEGFIVAVSNASTETGYIYLARDSGRVGVGTGSPGEEFEVAGDVLAVSYLHSSDERLKDQIETTDGLDTIRKLRGVDYIWRKDGKKDSGVIAQEIEQVLPWLVFTHPDSGMKAVQYDGLFGPVIESLKEHDKNLQMFNLMHSGLQRKVEENSRSIATLKEENDKLKDKVDKLEARLERLEKLLLKE